MAGVEATKEHIQAGDVFQLVLSQRFQRRTFADPFEVFRYGRIRSLFPPCPCVTLLGICLTLNCVLGFSPTTVFADYSRKIYSTLSR
jgi:anthranilate/para-aminobenzoate synthase component I